MAARPIVAFVMAGGEGTRLRPLTADMPKPALPFAGRCRIIDFALSNLVNSSIERIFVLLQYKPGALLDHLVQHWGRPPAGQRIVPVLPSSEFRGTADAVGQNLALLDEFDPELVAVFAADHVYRMDVRQMVRFHRGRDADVTVAALPVPLAQASQFGVIEAGPSRRITGFAEKPSAPRCCAHDPHAAYVSMGNYLFRTDVLRRALRDAARRGEYDFGHDVLPRLVGEANVYAYDFRENRVPGLKPTEAPAYWRDVGTVQAYIAAQRDVSGSRPLLEIDNPAWPIDDVPATVVCDGGPLPPCVRGALDTAQHAPRMAV